MKKSIFLFSLLIAVCIGTEALSISAYGQNGDSVDRGLYIPKTSDNLIASQIDSTHSAHLKTSSETGKICKEIDFEGVGDKSPIPVFDGIASPGWLGIIDEDAGGSGNFANEPSASTIAFWLEGDPASRFIVFEEPVAEISFLYASMVEIKLDAFDSNGNVIVTVTGNENFDRSTGDPTGQYNQWDPLTLSVEGNSIERVQVFGNENHTGIDNLRVCTTIGIESVEFTQAIQEIQTIEELQASLNTDNEPPVPIVAGKPTVARVYPAEIDTAADIKVRFSLNDMTAQLRTISVQPNCDVAEARLRTNGCPSIDFPFVAPDGEWKATITLLDVNDSEIESYEFEVESVASEPLVLGATRVCDELDSSGNWQCADTYFTRLGLLASLLRKISPTNDVRVIDTGETVRRDINNYDADSDGVISDDNREARRWWRDITRDIDRLNKWSDIWNDITGEEDRRYYGMVRNTIPGGILGRAAEINSNGAASLLIASDFGGTVDVSQDTVAHEVYHTLNIRHTNVITPSTTSAPGCSALAADNASQWPFPNNRIQSANGLEVGYDFAPAIPSARVLDPQFTYDIMSYCAPVWTSPRTYRQVQEALRPIFRIYGANATARVVSNHWYVSAVLEDSSILFDPLFVIESVEQEPSNDGEYVLTVMSADGSVLYEDKFDMSVSTTTSRDEEAEEATQSFFNLLIPYSETASEIVVKDIVRDIVGRIELAGEPPKINFTFPLGGEVLTETHTISWEVDDSDSSNHTYWVQYSNNNGSDGSWKNVAPYIEDDSLILDFSELAGGESSVMLRVIASDGINSAMVTSEVFTVPSKLPTAEILYPGENLQFDEGQIVWLQGIVHDIDDTVIGESNISWTSNLDGELGNGANLPVTSLSSGTHIISLTVTDSDGNVATDIVTVFVDGERPEMTLDVRLESPATCVYVGVISSDNQSTSTLNTTYSIDGGATWQEYSSPFFVPTTGFVHLIARVEDVAGNSVVQDRRFFIDGVCGQSAPTSLTPTKEPQLDLAPTSLLTTAEPDAASMITSINGQLAPDGAMQYTVSLNLTYASSTAIQLTVNGLPTGATYTVNPSTTPNDLFVNIATSNVAPGVYPIEIVATAGSSIQAVPTDLVVGSPTLLELTTEPELENFDNQLFFPFISDIK